MARDPQTLGTILRHLIEHLDGAVEDAYRAAGLAYRPRYTPIVRALLADGAASIRTLATHAGITHSAASQTVAHMAKDGLVTLTPGVDGRERIVALTAVAHAMLPEIERHWAATNAAARELDGELSMPLTDLLLEAVERLERRSFGDRIKDAAKPKTRGRKDA